MDLSFGRARRRRAIAPLRLDYPRLIAILSAAQAASRTAEIDGRLARLGAGVPRPLEELVALLDPGGQVAGAGALNGSFNPGVAACPR